MAEKMAVELKKAKTPKFRVSFPHVFEKHSGFEGQEPRYSVVMLFPKSTDLKDLQKAATNAATEKWGKDQKKWPKNLKWPFRDGDEKEDLEGYKGHRFVSATSNKKPGVVDNQVQPIMDEEEFYAGCYARATIIAFAYDKAGNKGVSFSLQNVQKLGDGETFSGRRKAEDDFESVEDSSNNEENYSDSGNTEESDEIDMGF